MFDDAIKGDVFENSDLSHCFKCLIINSNLVKFRSTDEVQLRQYKGVKPLCQSAVFSNNYELSEGRFNMIYEQNTEMYKNM
ncbi:hypothetical protein D3C73_1144830 [compost metagenome]